jgi:glutamine---fructose-6-phosphate transaminase (isomerizing)
MKREHEPYAHFALVREMLETPDVVRGLEPERIAAYAERVDHGEVLLTGEGSSRIFPAKKVIADALRGARRDVIRTEAATQALEYDLSNTTVFVASNSGRTKEGVRLIRELRDRGHGSIIGVVASPSSPIDVESDGRYILSCGAEKAVAATKSVIEQALFYDLLFRQRSGRPMPNLSLLGDLLEETLQAEVPEEVVAPLVDAGVVYWSGRNDGVAEELTLKTNEITRKKSDFLEGTYAAHGIEEVMDRSDALVLVNPFASEEEKLEQVLVRGVGLPIVAIGHRSSRFPCFRIPAYGEFTPYLELAAGWSLLVEVGVRLGIDLDRPTRARKIGNEI